MITVGQHAPNFTLRAQDGREISLADFRGKHVVVLYFYPKDFTPGCVREACAFRDAYDVFRDAGAQVIGVSNDSEETHRRFVGKHDLPFILCSDPGGKVAQQYGAKKMLGLIPGRVTFVIDRDGVVRMAFDAQFQALQHVDEALSAVRQLVQAQDAS